MILLKKPSFVDQCYFFLFSLPFLSLFNSINLSSINSSNYLSIPISMYLPVCLSIYLSIFLSIYFYSYLSISLGLFERKGEGVDQNTWQPRAPSFFLLSIYLSTIILLFICLVFMLVWKKRRISWREHLTT